jgi:hypothetical protein
MEPTVRKTLTVAARSALPPARSSAFERPLPFQFQGAWRFLFRVRCGSSRIVAMYDRYPQAGTGEECGRAESGR